MSLGAGVLHTCVDGSGGFWTVISGSIGLGPWNRKAGVELLRVSSFSVDVALGSLWLAAWGAGAVLARSGGSWAVIAGSAGLGGPKLKMGVEFLRVSSFSFLLLGILYLNGLPV
jgi:hypothetical protein